MTWTQPKTWINEPLIAGDMNTHLRDNLEALKDPPQDGTDIDASDYTTTSTTFVDVSADFNKTITTHGSDVLVTLCVSLLGSGTIRLDFDIEVDGNREGGDDGIISLQLVNTGYRHITLYHWVKGLNADDHVFKLQWKVSSGTATLVGGQDTLKSNGQYDVREVS